MAPVSSSDEDEPRPKKLKTNLQWTRDNLEPTIFDFDDLESGFVSLESNSDSFLSYFIKFFGGII